uniref:Putative secreted protein n=1 Tax=Ixodes ricinus TaxID=34613 RepID=A0A6B0TUS9_IXORI
MSAGTLSLVVCTSVWSRSTSSTSLRERRSRSSSALPSCRACSWETRSSGTLWIMLTEAGVRSPSGPFECFRPL